MNLWHESIRLAAGDGGSECVSRAFVVAIQVENRFSLTLPWAGKCEIWAPQPPRVPEKVFHHPKGQVVSQTGIIRAAITLATIKLSPFADGRVMIMIGYRPSLIDRSVAIDCRMPFWAHRASHTSLRTVGPQVPGIR